MNVTTKEFKKVIVALTKSELQTGEKVVYAKDMAKDFVANCNFSQLTKNNILRLIHLQCRYEFMPNNMFISFISNHYTELELE